MKLSLVDTMVVEGAAARVKAQKELAARQNGDFQHEEREVYSPSESYSEVPIVQQVHANLAMLDDLHRRLQFVMSEVHQIVKR